MEYLLRKYDDVPPTHVLKETYLRDGEIWQMRGYVFVTPELAGRLGEPDDVVRFGDHEYPAWKMASAKLPLA